MIWSRNCRHHFVAPKNKTSERATATERGAATRCVREASCSCQRKGGSDTTFRTLTFSAPNSFILFFVTLRRSVFVVVNPFSMSVIYWYIESNTNGWVSTHQPSRVSTRQRHRSAPLSAQHPNPAAAGTGIHTIMGNPAGRGSSLLCVCLQRAPPLLLFVVLAYSCEPLSSTSCNQAGTSNETNRGTQKQSLHTGASRPVNSDNSTTA
ncbi:unnamed protein product [Ectocarpus sp. 8 AP-2014]